MGGDLADLREWLGVDDLADVRRYSPPDGGDDRLVLILADGRRVGIGRVVDVLRPWLVRRRLRANLGVELREFSDFGWRLVCEAMARVAIGNGSWTRNIR